MTESVFLSVAEHLIYINMMNDNNSRADAWAYFTLVSVLSFIHMTNGSWKGHVAD